MITDLFHENSNVDKLKEILNLPDGIFEDLEGIIGVFREDDSQYLINLSVNRESTEENKRELNKLFGESALNKDQKKYMSENNVKLKVLKITPEGIITEQSYFNY